MKRTIITFIASLWLMNFANGQCASGSITYTGQSTICANSYTGDFTASGGSSTSITWQRKTGNGSFVTVDNGLTGISYSNFVGSAETYKFRALWVDGSTQCPSNEITITVQDASGGTLSISPTGSICSGGSAPTLSVTGQFGSDLYWEYQFNSGSWTSFGALFGQSSIAAYTSAGVGQYNYRVAAQCPASSYDYSNTVSLAVSNPTQAAICNDADELRRAVAKVSISGIPYAFSGFLVNHSAQDGRLLFLTTSHPFTRYNPSQSTLNNATFTWNEDLNTCGGSASQTVTSVGCTVKAIDGFFALLELNAAPAMPGGQLYYLGWDINATDNYSSIFQSAASIKKGKVTTTASPSTVSGSFANNSDNFNESSGSGVFKFTNWSSGNTEKQGRGAPLLAGTSGKKARGVYIAGTEATCGNGPSYFVYLTSSYTSLLSYLRDGSETNTATVKMNYCVPYLELSGNLTQSPNPQPQVATYIKSTENINNNIVVRYKAGTYIELNPGFSSGNDFIAEIDPCVSVVTVIASKTDEQYWAQDFQEQELQTDNPVSWLKIYPTILPSGNSITIEANDEIDGTELYMFDIQGKHVRSFRLNGFLKGSSATVPLDVQQGFYIIKARKGNDVFTQKIVIQ